MNKKYFKIVFAFALVGAMFSSCQDEDIENIGDVNNQELSVPDTNNIIRTSTKSGVGYKFSEIYFLSGDGEEFHKYKTIKIRNIQGTICQEWFYEDLHEYWFDYLCLPDDKDGIVHGYFYPWENNISDVSQSDWDYLIFNSNLVDNETGFHIPNQSDLYNLGEIVGRKNKSRIRKLLNAKKNGSLDLRKPESWTENGPCFWYNPIDYVWWSNNNGVDPNLVNGCGAMVSLTVWLPEQSGWGDGLAICYTNVEELCCNIRLMRTITKEQW